MTTTETKPTKINMEVGPEAHRVLKVTAATDGVPMRELTRVALRHFAALDAAKRKAEYATYREDTT
jgi:hypothetical protein